MSREKSIDFLIYASVFMESIMFFREPFEGYLHYFIFLLLLPFFFNRFGLPKAPFQIILLPFFVGIFQIFMGNNEWFLFFKIFLGVMLSTTFYYYVIQYYEMNIEKMFKMYLTWAYWSAIIGILQYISAKIGFKPGYNYQWIYDFEVLVNKSTAVTAENTRINSFYIEPSQMGIMLGPAAFVSILNMITKKSYEYKSYQNYVILIAIYLTKSSTGYIGIFFVILIIGLNLGYFSYLILFIAIGILAGVGLYNSVDEFKGRVDAAVGLWVDNDFDIKNVNTSSFVQYNHAHIAYNNILEHPFWGTGLGSHPVAFEKYSYTRTGKVNLKGFDNNSADANSLFLRLMSETGLMGVIFIIVLVFRCFVGNDGIDNKYWIISGSILVLILLYLMRQGNYFLNGFPFFVWLYYYNRKAYIEERQNRLVIHETPTV